MNQGDTLSPTLFSMFTNDLAADVENVNCGVDAGGINVSILIYADDIVLIAPDENCLQKNWMLYSTGVKMEDGTKISRLVITIFKQ